MHKKGLVLILVSFVFVFTSCQSNQQNQMDQQYKAAYVAINKILDNGNVDELDKYITQDAVDHQLDTSITKKTGLEGIKEAFRYYHNIYPDMKTTIHSMAVTGDTLFGYCTSVGTASQPFMGMPAGSQMTLNAVDVVVFSGDKMSEHWGFMDMSDAMKMMQQQQMNEGMKQK
ncbi:MAG: ester cyclase [Ignavibacteriaceae bacterium]